MSSALGLIQSAKLNGQYLAQTEHHVTVLTGVCQALGAEPGEMTPGCRIVQHTGKSLVAAMQLALAEGDPAAAELVACECVVLAETKDHADWELIGECAKAAEAPSAQVLQAAYDEIEDEEDQHLYHTKGWCRELWLRSLGLKSVIPPSEEKMNAKSAAAAEQARHHR